MRIVQFCPDDYPSSGVNTFATELDRALRGAGIASQLVRHAEEIGELDPRESVMHLHGLWLPAFHHAVTKSRKAGVPIVWSTHGMTAPWSMRHKWWKKKLVWWLCQRCDLTRAVAIHATSEQEVGWVRDLGFRQQIVQVPLGTHLPHPDPLRQEARTARRTLLFVGRIYPVKAIDRLIEAFVRAKSHHPMSSNWVLRLVGPDQIGYRAELESLASRLGCEDVEFAGPKFGVELDAEYTNCDALALVSHTENFGATVVDALAHGKPVVTSTKTPWREVADYGCGWWVDNDVETLAATITELFNTQVADLKAMGERGRTLVESRYTWDAVARQMKEAYEHVLHQ